MYGSIGKDAEVTPIHDEYKSSLYGGIGKNAKLTPNHDEYKSTDQGDSQKKVNLGEDIINKDVEAVTRRQMRSMKKELERDQVSTFCMILENNTCYDNLTIYTVEVPICEQKLPKVVEAKER